MNQEQHTELKPRLVTLSGGAEGLRGGLAVEVKMLGEDEAVMIASDATLDRYNEVIEPTAWDLKEYLRNPVVVDSHRYDSIALILGRSTRVEVKDGRLINQVKFATDNPLGELARKMTKGGFIRSESVGFIPREWKRGNTPGEPERTYTKAELLEISLVAVPANPGATIEAALKSGAVDRSDVRAVVEALKEFCSTADPETIPGSPGPRIHERALHDLRSLQRALKG